MFLFYRVCCVYSTESPHRGARRCVCARARARVCVCVCVCVWLSSGHEIGGAQICLGCFPTHELSWHLEKVYGFWFWIALFGIQKKKNKNKKHFLSFRLFPFGFHWASLADVNNKGFPSTHDWELLRQASISRFGATVWARDSFPCYKHINKVREKSRECHCHKPQPLQETPRGRGKRQNQTSANLTNVRKALKFNKCILMYQTPISCYQFIFTFCNRAVSFGQLTSQKY